MLFVFVLTVELIGRRFDFLQRESQRERERERDYRICGDLLLRREAEKAMTGLRGTCTCRICIAGDIIDDSTSTSTYLSEG